MKDVFFEVDGLTLRGKMFRTDSVTDLQPAALLLHGWESRQDRMFDLAERLAGKGYTCLTFDMRGHGTSDGDHKTSSRKDFVKDVVAGYDVLTQQQNVDTSRIISIGSSFGGYMAALLSAERNLSGLVLRVPADYRDQGIDEPLYDQRSQWEHSEWKEKNHAYDETAALRAVHAFERPVLVVESEKDEVVPAATVQSYRDAVHDPDKLTYVIMKDAPHSISRHPELQQEFTDIVVSWINKVQ